ncbi:MULTISPECIES: TrbC/VirB2 family protein [Desulfovibrio]|uniref:Type IV secretion system protein VirB2 n=2 Tax=Desulfovibrio TaxID=872 RepID=A0AA94L2N6_DESDE|nr:MULTISPECIES: TrbC/VirB2 family protein [Desulfovibrio]SFW55460.1 type IV secretion system protein VirB2 [Desulfovibrio desulfuricans]SPD35105.1 Conjugal transfer protein, TrbC, pilus precusor [Desulfovibrio sp. G11]
MYRGFFFIALIFFFGVCPDLALASGGISEFTGPLEKVVNTITGPAGKLIGAVGMALCGIYMIVNKDDISGGFKYALNTVFAISFLAFAVSMMNSLFSFSGAVV